LIHNEQHRPPLYIKLSAGQRMRVFRLRNCIDFFVKYVYKYTYLKYVVHFPTFVAWKRRKKLISYLFRIFFIEHGHNMLSWPSLVTGFTVYSAGMITAVSRISFVMKWRTV
jgi:hypothetical protein